MITTFYILLFLALWHFFYESVLASSLRHGLRYEFFELRDKLRMLKIDNDLSEKDQKIFKLIDNSICGMIEHMSFISIANHIRLQMAIEKDEKIKKSIERKGKFISDSDNKTLLEIDIELHKLGVKALLINNGGWLLYGIIPFLIYLAIVFFNQQMDKLNYKLSKVSSRLIYSSDNIKDRYNIPYVY